MQSEVSAVPATKARPQDRAVLVPELIDRFQVRSLCSISDHLLDDLMERGHLPRPIKLARKAVRWRRSAVLAAIERLSAESEARGITQ